MEVVELMLLKFKQKNERKEMKASENSNDISKEDSSENRMKLTLKYMNYANYAPKPHSFLESKIFKQNPHLSDKNCNPAIIYKQTPSRS